ncbi:MAG: pyruvate kinase [Pseudomonadota bacterium]
MLRRTKIVATLGPATDEPGVLKGILEAGVDVVRLNFSHGDAEAQCRRAAAVREMSEIANRHVGILVDLQGPKIRIARFKEGKVFLKEGAPFVLDVDLPPDVGDEGQVGCYYEKLPHDVKPGHTLLLDDGRVVLDVQKIEGSRILCKVVVGGDLSNHKGINLQGGGLSAPALTDKDKEDIVAAAKIDADYVAISFPRQASDIHQARELLLAAGCSASIVSKIERAEALEVIDEIIEASDAIMVARGDLGVEIGDASLPPVQKYLISRARALNRVVITATQMMESMIHNALPTRAEVFDVANAVFDGTDAIMLSAETAAGKYPVKAVEAMHRVCMEAEKQPHVRTSDHRMDMQFKRTDEAIAMSAMYLANHSRIKCIAALTESGSTTLWMSRISSGIPIFALTSHQKTCRKVTLYRGVYPVSFTADSSDHAEVNRALVAELQKLKQVEEGDQLIITKGDLTGVPGGTNALKVVRIGDMV